MITLLPVQFNAITNITNYSALLARSLPAPQVKMIIRICARAELSPENEWFLPPISHGYNVLYWLSENRK